MLVLGASHAFVMASPPAQTAGVHPSAASPASSVCLPALKSNKRRDAKGTEIRREKLLNRNCDAVISAPLLVLRASAFIRPEPYAISIF